MTGPTTEKGLAVFLFDSNGIWDWVAAESEQAAREWYQAESDLSDADMVAIKVSRVDDIDKPCFGPADEPEFTSTLRQIIADWPWTFPAIVASTEW